MKKRTEIEGRVRALLVEELDRRVEEASKRRPTLCVHNHRHPLDARKMVDGEPNEMYNRITLDDGTPTDRTIGLCMLGADNPEEWGGNICEDDIDAQRCSFFTPLKTKDDLLVEFEEQLSTEGGLARHLPVVAELLWVIEETRPPRLPWWRRLLYWFLRIRVEPPMSAKDPLGLLNAASEVSDDEGVSS